MKKKLYIIVLTFCFMLALVGKSYGQGWERTLLKYDLNYPVFGVSPLNDGGCIATFPNWDYLLNNSNTTTGSQGLFITRLDKNGNKIWNNKPLYQFTPTIIDSNLNPIIVDFDTLYGANIYQAIQLPNNNIVIMHNGDTSFFTIDTRKKFKYFTIIDNYGNRIKRIHNLGDTLQFTEGSGMSDEKMYYNSSNNTIECVALRKITIDSILFVKNIYDANLNRLNTIQKIIYKRNSLISRYTNTLYFSTMKSVNGNYYWYDNASDGATSYVINSSEPRVLKLNNFGNLVYDTLLPFTVVNNILDIATPTNYRLIKDPFYTYYPVCMDIDENLKNETVFVMTTICNYDTLNSNPNPIDYLYYFKTLYVVNVLDSIGNFISSKTINSKIDTFGLSYDYSNNHFPNGDQVFVKYINDDTLLILKTDGSMVYFNKPVWEATKINPKIGNILSQNLIPTLGFKNYYQGTSFDAKLKVNSLDQKGFFVSLFYKGLSQIDFGIAKIDNNGFPFGNVLIGNIYNDANNNCIKNNLEKSIPNYTVTATKNNFSNYGTSDRNGNYLIGLADSGNYNVSIRNNIDYPLWNAVCNPIQNILVENEIAFDTVNFALKPSILCPFNTVNISTNNNFRIGQPQTYFVSYCNNGTVASPNTYITIKLDSLLDFNSSMLTYTTLPNNTYRFNIGNLDYLTCGNFTFVATPKIGAVQLGQTLCAEAHIYPDTVCTTPNYVGAFIEARATCLGDSVRLQLENTGNGNMTVPKRYIVIEGNVMRINNPYQLNINQILTETLKADSGKTYRIIAEQPDGLPASYGDKFATAAVENCEPRANFPTGFFTQFPNYDGEPFRALSCNVITAAFDPNDKVASPVGYASQHYIETNTQIDYQINFQNTGNDTAFKVVVVDTISSTLNINSIQLGVASHRYQFQRTDSNVIQFVFDSIMLVDSFKNERLSHGFIKFKIQQKPNNVDGTKIYNKAAIYFDYNAPIITNQTYHTIGRNFIQVNLLTEIKNTKFNVKEVKVFPNPFREKTQIIVESNDLKNPILLLMNIEGKIVKTISASTQNTFNIYREDLNNGIYIFRVMQDNDIVTNGKLVVQ